MREGRWSADEDEILMAHYPKRGCRWEGWESLLPGRSESAIYHHAKLIGLVRGGSTVVKMTKDPYEHDVFELMNAGMAPSQIDAMMKWQPGKARLIISERWKRLRRE